MRKADLSIRYLIAICFMVLAACHSTGKGKDQGDTGQVKKDTISYINEDSFYTHPDKYIDAIYKSFETIHKYDSVLNPFVYHADKVPFITCDSFKNNREVFKCVIGQFQIVKHPIMLYSIGGYYNIMYDSIFISRVLGDSLACKRETKDMFRYGKGIIIDECDNYVWVIYTRYGPDTYEYILSTFTSNGQLINSKSIFWSAGGIGDDRDLGIIHSNRKFEIDHLKFLHDNSDKLENKKMKILDGHEHYLIDSKGKFILQSSDSTFLKVYTN